VVRRYQSSQAETDEHGPWHHLHAGRCHSAQRFRSPRHDEYAHRDRSSLDDHVAVRSENYRTADHAQAERCIHHVGRIALRAFAYYGTPLEVSTSKQSGFPADSENDRRVAGRDHSCPYLCRPGSVFTFSLPAGRDAYAKSPRRSMHSELKRSRKKGEQDNGGDIRLHSERTKVTSARVNLVQPQSQHWRIEMKYNRLGNSGLFVSLIQRISRVSPAAGGTGRTSYICLAPINPINGFWLYRFIKLKTGEGGCDPYSDGRHAVQHRRESKSANVWISSLPRHRVCW